jgi:hypothetical protein
LLRARFRGWQKCSRAGGLMPAKTGSKSVCVCYLKGAIRSGFATSHPNRCSFIKQDASGNSIRLDRDMGQYRIRLTTAGMVARVRIVNSSRRALAEPEHKGSQKELPFSAELRLGVVCF